MTEQNRDYNTLLPVAKAISARIPSDDVDENTGLSGAVQGANATVEEIVAGVHKTVITLNRSVALIDNAGVGAHLSSQLYAFPQGDILILGAVSNLQITKSSAGVNATFNGDIGVGTAACDNTNTLSSTEQNIIPTTSTPAAVAGVTTGKAKSTATLIVDNTGGTGGAVYLNQLVDDADQDVTTTPANLLFQGTITLSWVNLGDY